MARFMQTTLWVLLLLLILCAGSYWKTATPEGSFQLGLPWVFYYQMDYSSPSHLMHLDWMNLVKDFLVLWVPLLIINAKKPS